MKYLIKCNTLEQQLEILEKRGLIIDDPSILTKINYSHLIYKYGNIYLDENKGKYKKGSKISNIYNLYLFHLKISTLLFRVIIQYEQKLKTHIADTISEVDINWYSDKANYSQEFSNSKERTNFLSNMADLNMKIINKIDDKYINNGFAPMWIMVDNMAFGQLRMICKLFDGRDKIFSKMNLNFSTASITLGTVNEYRNQLFHGNELKSKLKSERDKTEYKLIKFFKLIRIQYPKEFSQIIFLVKELDECSIGISKKEILVKLGISGLFK